jgi:two-component system, NtrC family, sensor kinase
MMHGTMHAQEDGSDSLKYVTTKDSLLQIINLHKSDTNEVNALAYLVIQIINFGNFSSDSAVSSLKYAERGIDLARILDFPKGEADCLYGYSAGFFTTGDINQGVFYGLKALELYENIGDLRGVSETDLALQGSYREMGDVESALAYELNGEHLADVNGLISKFGFEGQRLAPLFLGEIAKTYLDRNQVDSSFFYAKKALAQNELFHGTVWNFPVYLLGRIQTEQAHYPEALETFRKALPLAISNRFYSDTLQIFSGLSSLYLKTGNLDSAIYYARIVYLNQSTGEPTYILQSIANIALAYRLKSEKDSAFKYFDIRDLYRDSIYNREKLIYVQHVAFNQKLRQQELIASQLKYKEKLRFYLLTAGLAIFLLVAVFLWRNNLHRKKDYVLLEKQKQETDHQKTKTEQALSELKTTQTQLIQSAKMASLGELTAGIAHEIQNPLNFVNNFSDVNQELLAEMKDEIDQGNLQEVKRIAKDVMENEVKINHHGKRADSIVKGMLQHSRVHAGQKIETDINLLTDEYLNLSYHGIRAKEKTFNVSLHTDYGENIGKVSIIPQDFGRVLLNLFNNAFYAVAEKQKKLIDGYEPSISIITKRTGDYVEIILRDNGIGIPKNILDKIFQPFFTTKPAGQGTGLGLSLSYDIIQSHGGDLTAHSKEEEGAEFLIRMPG